MLQVSFEKFNLNRFWEKTPVTLKYVLVFAVLITTLYFLFSKRIDESRSQELEAMKSGITATYELIDNFENFKREQDEYNKEVIMYLKNLHSLVEELNSTTNRKFDMILKSSDKNTDEIIERIMLLNESFEKISKIYNESLKTPNLEESKVDPHKK